MEVSPKDLMGGNLIPTIQSGLVRFYIPGKLTSEQTSNEPHFERLNATQSQNLDADDLPHRKAQCFGNDHRSSSDTCTCPCDHVSIIFMFGLCLPYIILKQ